MVSWRNCPASPSHAVHFATMGSSSGSFEPWPLANPQTIRTIATPAGAREKTLIGGYRVIRARAHRVGQARGTVAGIPSVGIAFEGTAQSGRIRVTPRKFPVATSTCVPSRLTNGAAYRIVMDATATSYGPPAKSHSRIVALWRSGSSTAAHSTQSCTPATVGGGSTAGGIHGPQRGSGTARSSSTKSILVCPRDRRTHAMP